MSTAKISLDFYALGNLPKNIDFPKMTYNSAFKDNSNDLLHRNKLSLNSNNTESIRNTHKALSTLFQTKIDTNNYLNPLGAYKSQNIYNIENNMVNKETYRLTKEKLFAKDTNPEETLNKGMSLPKKDFLEKKTFYNSGENLNTERNSSTNYKMESTKTLKENNFYFDKNNKIMIRYPRNFFKKEPEKPNRTKVSKAAPEWFQVVTDEKNKKFDEIIAKNEETLSVLSRYKSWITVTPKSKNRKMPLEKMKIEHFDETSRIMPNWMQIKAKKDKELYEMMKSVEYNSIRNGKKYMMLVDRNTNDRKETLKNPNKSIFSIGDFRHNLVMKEDADYYSSLVSHNPKQMLAWDDGKKFNPKFKKDK